MSRLMDIFGKINFFSDTSGVKKTELALNDLGLKASEVEGKLSGGLGKASNQAGTFRQRLNNAGEAINDIGGKADNSKEDMQAFDMSMLGVMFAGMQLSMTMQSLFRPAAKAFGIMDQFSAMLTSVFAPTLAVIQPFLTAMVNAFVGLPKTVKLGVGAIAALLLVLGKGLFLVGAIKLGLDALSVSLATVGSFFMSVVAPILVFIGAVTAIITVFDKWGKAWGTVAAIATIAIGVILGIFVGLPVAIGAVLAGVVGLLIGWWDEIKSIFATVANWFMSDWNFEEAFNSAWQSIKTTTANVIDFLGDQIDWLIDKIMSIPGVSTVADFASEAGSLIGSGVSAVGSLFNDFVMSNGKIHRISPNDNIIGFKGRSPLQGGGGANQVNVEVNVDSVDSDIDMRELADRISERVETQIDGRVRR